MDKLIAEMKALNSAIEDLVGKKDLATNDAEKSVIEKMIEAKTAEFQAGEVKLDEMKAKEARAKILGSLEKERGELEAKEELADVTVSKSEHNEENAARARDAASMSYLTHPDSANAALNGMSGEMAVAIKGKGKDNEGVQAPRWMAKFIMPQTTGEKIIEQELGSTAALFAAKTEYPVHSDDATGVNSGGGSMVPNTYVPELFKQARIIDDLPSRCWVKPDVGGTTYFPKLTQSGSEPFGVTVTWGNAGSAGGEGVTVVESDPVFSQIGIGVERLAALSYVSLKELRVNNVGLEAEMAWIFRNAISRAISLKIIAGNGTAQPTGVNSATAITGGVVQVAREVVDTVSYTDLVNLEFAVVTGQEVGSTYVLSTGANGAMKYVAGLDDTYGRPVLRSDNWMAGLGVVPTLNGYPYIHTPANAENLGLEGDVIFGNFRNYGLVAGSVDIARSDQFAFDKGHVAFRVITYVGGKPLDYASFSLLSDASGESSSSST